MLRRNGGGGRLGRCEGARRYTPFADAPFDTLGHREGPFGRDAPRHTLVGPRTPRGQEGGDHECMETHVNRRKLRRERWRRKAEGLETKRRKGQDCGPSDVQRMRLWLIALVMQSSIRTMPIERNRTERDVALGLSMRPHSPQCAVVSRKRFFLGPGPIHRSALPR